MCLRVQVSCNEYTFVQLRQVKEGVPALSDASIVATLFNLFAISATCVRAMCPRRRRRRGGEGDESDISVCVVSVL